MSEGVMAEPMLYLSWPQMSASYLTCQPSVIFRQFKQEADVVQRLTDRRSLQ